MEVQCKECEKGWSLPTTPSIHEIQALESCPCPYCGACVLTVQTEQPAPKKSRKAVLAR